MAATKSVQRAERYTLGIPACDGNDLGILIQASLPVWEVQFHIDDDRIGRPYWRPAWQASVNPGHPGSFTHLNVTRFGNAMLTIPFT